MGARSRLLLVLVTDLPTVDERALAARLEACAAAGEGTLVLLRDKSLAAPERAALAARLRERTRARGLGLVIASDEVLAERVGADGVHLPASEAARLGPLRVRFGAAATLGVACHTPEEVAEAARAGASYALLSPIFPSPGKGAPLGLAALTDARARLDRLGAATALVALGGVDASVADACLAAGADAVAAIRADLAAWLSAHARGRA